MEMFWGCCLLRTAADTARRPVRPPPPPLTPNRGGGARGKAEAENEDAENCVFLNSFCLNKGLGQPKRESFRIVCVSSLCYLRKASP